MSHPDYLSNQFVDFSFSLSLFPSFQAWDDANKRALELAAAPGAVLIHPFDHPDIW